MKLRFLFLISILSLIVLPAAVNAQGASSGASIRKRGKNKAQETVQEEAVQQEEPAPQQQVVQAVQEEVKEAAQEEAKEDAKEKRAKRKSRGASQDDPEHWGTIDDVVAAQKSFGVYHNWGAAWSSISRIQKKEKTSNFVWNDKMLGAFYEIQSHDMKNFSDLLSLNFMGRFGVYYPYRYRFRDVRQNTVQTLLYAFDWYTGLVLTFNIFDYVRIDVEAGLHMLYQLHDMWHYFNLGPGAKIDIEWPISPGWTMMVGGMFSWDNGNLGSNRTMRPFDYVYQYQTQVGFRYSKARYNKGSLFKYKPRKPKTKRVRKIKMLSPAADIDIDENGEVVQAENTEPQAAEPPKEEAPATQNMPGVRR